MAASTRYRHLHAVLSACASVCLASMVVVVRFGSGCGDLVDDSDASGESLWV